MAKLTILLDGDPKAPHQARLAATLQALGHQPILVNAPEVADRARAEFGQEVPRLELPRIWPLALRDALVRRQIRKLGAQLVHLNYLHPGQLLWQRLGLPYVATAWGSDLNDQDFARPAQHWQQMGELLRGAAAVTADSQPLLDRAQALAGTQPLRQELVLWGVDCARFDASRLAADIAEWRAELHIDERAFVVLSPRQTLPHYHPERILSGFAGMQRKPDDVLVFKLHGRDAERLMQKELLELAAQHGVADRLRFAPPCPYDRLPGLYAAADVAVSALEVDGVPSTFAELMSLQVPIVASDLPAYRTILGDGRGLLFAPDATWDLTVALDRLRADPVARAEMARQARTWALEHADWQQSVAAWLALYEQAVADSGVKNG
jgi:glycosyltransferase involved in cell wall biosynthesis